MLGSVTLALVADGGRATAALRPTHTIDPDKLAAVQRGDIARSVVATGKIEPLTKVEVKSKASGIVEKIYLDAGDKVKTGQVLAELDKEQLQASVAEARGIWKRPKPRSGGGSVYQKNLVDAEGPDVPFLKNDVDRAHDLFKQGLIALNVMQDAEKTISLG